MMTSCNQGKVRFRIDKVILKLFYIYHYKKKVQSANYQISNIFLFQSITVRYVFTDVSFYSFMS